MVVVVFLNAFFIWFPICLSPPTQCLAIIYLKWEFWGKDFRTLRSLKPIIPRPPNCAVLFILFLASPLQCLANYVLLGRMQLSLTVLCPLIAVQEDSTRGCIHTLTAWQLNCVLPSKFAAWEACGMNPLANSQHRLGCIFCVWWRRALLQCCQ